MIICSIIDKIFKLKFKQKLSSQGFTADLFRTIYFTALFLRLFGQPLMLRGQMKRLGTATTSKLRLPSTKLLAAFQVELASTHSSTVLR